jgi:hypothetical protein
LIGDPRCHTDGSGPIVESKLLGRRTIYVQIILRKHFRTLVDRSARTVEDTPQHVLRHRKLHARSSEFYVGSLDVDTGRSFEYLYDRLFALDLENLTSPSRTIGKGESNDFVVRGELERIGVRSLEYIASFGGCMTDLSLTLTLSRTTKGLTDDGHLTKLLDGLKYGVTHPLTAETVR